MKNRTVARRDLDQMRGEDCCQMEAVGEPRAPTQSLPSSDWAMDYAVPVVEP
jgi:hypothetical protein